MADITAHVKTRPRGGRDEHNYEYYQHSNEEANFSSGVTIAANKTGLVAVIDALVVSSLAAETFQISTTSGEVFGPHHIAANSQFVLPSNFPIRADAANLALTFTMSSGQGCVSAVYHYESDAEGDAIEENFNTQYY
tara:strand:+ start:7690 stop:8100 length:411 start_codon:yes stop_codon:yes gene_type:complete